MTHRVRLLARYAADFVIYVEGALWHTPKRFQAKDVSRGGLFIRTEEAPEIFSAVQLRIILPWGGDLRIAGRIVHLVSEDKAKSHGTDCGCGIEFLDLTAAERQIVQQLVSWAKAGDPGRCIPKHKENAVLSDINPMLGYVLAAVDGKRDIHDIADRLQLETAATESMLIQLNDLGMVHLGDSATVTMLSLRASSTTRGMSVSPDETEDTPPTSAKVSQIVDCKELDKLWTRSSVDHYQFLGVPSSAAQGEIRAAYFTLSKQFHPENSAPGPYQRKLDEVFNRLTEAYGALSSPSLRKQYDAYLSRAQNLTVPQLPKAPVAARTPISLKDPQASAAPRTVRSATHGAAASVLAHKLGGDPNRGPTSTSTKQMPPVAPPQDAGPASLDLVKMHLAQAIKDCDSDDMAAAARSLSLLEALDWDRPELRKAYDEVDRKVCTALAPTYVEQARYEANQQRWKLAARSWLKACRGRPNDPECHRSAAEALLADKTELRKARDLAQRAVELAPKDALARRVLGHVYLEAGMFNNARRELDVAASLNRGDEDTQRLLLRVAECAA